jgi:cation/acetate symporter
MFVKSTSFLGDMNPNWFFGIEPNAFGAIGALVNFAVAFLVMSRTNKVPKEVEKMVENIRIPAAN